MSEETLTFGSEEERIAAIDALDESNPETVDKLYAIREATIVEKAEEADPEDGDTPAPKLESEPETPPETQPKPVIQEAAPSPKEWLVKPEDLPENYDTPGKAFKTLLHQAEYIKKQAEQMEAMRQKYESQPLPQPQEPVRTEQPQVTNFDAQITNIRSKLTKQIEEDPYSPEVFKMQDQIIDLKESKMKAEIEAAKNEFKTVATSQFEQYRQSKEQEEIDKKNKQTIEKDYEEIDKISKNKEYKEYSLSKPAKEVEKDFVMLRDEIVKAYYGRPPQSFTEISNALQMYANQSPSMMTALQAMNIPTEYPEDVLKYLEYTKLLNVRDGVMYNENGEQMPYRTRWDPTTQKDVPDRLNSLEDAIEHQRIRTGYYKKKQLESYDKGRKDITNALGKRDINELQPDEGSTGIDATSLEQLVAERDKIPETSANLEKIMEINNRIEQMLTTKTT